MFETTRTRVAGAVVAAFFTGLINPAFFGGTADPWGKFIFDYQTLIAGIAAVAAATWTIAVMEKTDSRQEQRHRELVTLSRRSDILRLSRAIEPQLGELIEAGDRIRFLSLDTSRFEDRGDPNYRMVSSVAGDYLKAAHDVIELLERPQFTDGSSLFDGYLTHATGTLLKSSEYMANTMTAHLRAGSGLDGNFTAYYDDDFDGPETTKRVRAFLPLLDAVVKDLQRVQAEMKA